jgi:hypothetical protein
MTTHEDHVTHDDDVVPAVLVGRLEVLDPALLRAAGRGEVRLAPVPAADDPGAPSEGGTR